MEGAEAEQALDPPDDAVVVRGGEMRSVEQLRSQAEANALEGEGWCLSVFASAQCDFEGVVRAARAWGEQNGERCLPHGRVHRTTAGKIRAAGLELVSTPPPEEHYLLMLPDPQTDQVYEAVMEAFDPWEPNPLGRMR